MSYHAKLQISYGMRVFLTASSLMTRDIAHFLRQPTRIAGAVGVPLMFWLVLGSGFGEAMRPPGGAEQTGYTLFFLPGAVTMVVLFGSIFSAISLIQDRNSGFLKGILVTPAPRLGIALGKITGWSLLSSLQGWVLLIAGMCTASYQGYLSSAVTWLQIGTAFGVVALIAMLFSALGFIFAWKIQSVQGFHAVMNLLLFPLWMLSGAFFPETTAAYWVQWVMQLNPLNYGVIVMRYLIQPDQVSVYTNVSYSSALGVLIGVVLLLVILAGLLVKRR